MEYYAHSLQEQPPEKWQLLEKHLAQTAERAAQFAAPFLSEEWARLAGWLYDLGKADSTFQEYLRQQNGLDDPDHDSENRNHSSGGKVNHSSVGATCAVEKLRNAAGGFWLISWRGTMPACPTGIRIPAGTGRFRSDSIRREHKIWTVSAPRLRSFSTVILR